MSLKNKYITIFGLTIVLLSFNSCSKLKKISTDNAETILKNELRVKYVSKAIPQYILIENASIKIEGEETNRAKINFFMDKGDKFFVSLKLLGFEMMRFQLTKDSVKYINRLNREYYFENIEKVQNELGVLLNFNILENIVSTGFLLHGSGEFDKFFNNSTISGDSLLFSNELGPGQKVLCNYSLDGLQLFNLAFFDYVKQLETKMIFNRNEFGLNSVEGIFVRNGDAIKFSLNINEIKNEEYSKTDFRIGRNYNEIKSLL